MTVYSPSRISLLFGLCAALVSGWLVAAEAGRVVFTAGDARIEQRAAQAGDSVQEGEALHTGAEGYIYVKTADQGFLILRPDSSARFVAYRIDAAHPENTRIKIELLSGVARHVSGEAVKAARQNFRFNTPVGAIGVRGTDFTVYTDQDVSRISVAAGGVVVSGFGGACSPDGSGPCESAQSRELFAAARGQILQLNRGQPAPQVLRGSDAAPDQAKPPRKDEPAATTSNAADSVNLDALKTAQISELASTAAARAVPLPAAPAVPSAPVISLPDTPAQVVWGRWQPVLDQGSEIDLGKMQKAYDLLAMSGNYVILRDQKAVWQPPVQSAAGFTLNAYQATFLDETTRAYTAVKIENGQLDVSFAKSTFATRFDLVNQSERFARQAQGTVTRDGRLAGNGQFEAPTNMAVQGVLSSDKGLAAAYVFQTRIDDRRVASGVTAWTAK